MSWWNLGGMNPKYKDFVEKHPDKTMIGMAWAFQWRFVLVIFIFEMLFFLCLILLGVFFGLAFHQVPDTLAPSSSLLNTQ